MGNEISQLNLNEIIPNRYQPREVFDDDSLNELAQSIKQHGVIQPIIVRSVNDKYEIVDGERRYKASLIAGLTQIPAIVRNYDDNESARIALIDNLQRKDLTPIEEARAYKRLLEMENMTQEELASTLGKSQSAVANKIRLLNLPLEIQEALLNNKISERHARSLLTVKDVKLQIELLNKIIEKRMTVRELDSEIKNMSNMFIPEEFNNNDNNEVMDNKFIMNDNNYVNNDTSMPSDNKFINNINDNMVNNQNNNQFINEPFTFNNGINDNGSNPFLTDNIYNPPVADNQNDNGTDMFSNPFASIRHNSEINNNELNNQSVINQSPDFSFNITNPYANDEQKVLNENDNYNTPTAFNIDDYKLPGVEYEEKGVSNEFDNNNVVNNNNSNMQNYNQENEYKYIENNPNYTSVDKNYGVSSLDEVINVLKETLDKLKQGKVKIDTEEIDFDDTYQIIIKVDKKGDFN